MGKWSLNTKVSLIVGILVFVSIAISYVAISKMSSINDSLIRIVDRDANRLEAAMRLRAKFLGLIIDEKNLILAESKEAMEKIAAKSEKTSEDIDQLISEQYKIATEAGKKNLFDIVSAKKEWRENYKAIQKYSLANDSKSAFALSTGKGRELRIKIENIAESIVDRNHKRMLKSYEEANAAYKEASLVMILTSVIGIFLGIAVAFYVMKALNLAIDKVITHLSDNSIQVTAAAQQIASAAVELSHASTEQAASLEETSASIVEMNSIVQKNAENAKETTTITVHSKENAYRGKEVVHQMITAIDEINQSNEAIKNSIDESNRRVFEIVEVINEIGNKTKVINDIVFQTKLLSFNASVEAARAGENGKGFAVVAEEIGSLAAMSGKAATEITTLLEASVRKVESIVNSTKTQVDALVKEGKIKVESGTVIAKRCGEVLDKIVIDIGTVNKMAEEISSACQEQAIGVNEITKAMGQLDQVTQTNTASSEEAAQAGEEISAQALSLRKIVDVLVETINGSNVSHDNRQADVIPLKKKKIYSVPLDEDIRFKEI